jgi:pantoate--beta-alanine ligase
MPATSNIDIAVRPEISFGYPRDEELCHGAGVAILFAPDAQEIYPPEFQTFVEPGELAKPLRGSFRPGRFRGVATVVSKLFNMVQPDLAFFGQKDFPQCAVVRRMVIDLNLPIEIVTVSTIRRSQWTRDKQSQPASQRGRASARPCHQSWPLRSGG